MEKKSLEMLQEHILTRSVPCDSELQELMHQIDIMVNNKKLQWEKKMQALEAKMTVRDQELANAQSKLDQKGQEVGLLKQKLDNLQKTKYEMAQNYDTQLQSLKTQFAKLTQSYEKLQLHQLKQNKIYRKEGCIENQEASFELNSLNQKLEEFRAKSKEWDKQEMLYQNHLVSLDAQRKLLSEKCNLFQKQAQNCQIQMCCSKLKHQGDRTCGQCKSEPLNVQQDVFPESTDRNEFFMEKLKSTVSDIAVSRNRLQEENRNLQQEVKMYQRKCQNIEGKFTEVKNELQSRKDLLNMVELECQQLHKEVARIEEYKNKEDNEIKLRSAYAQCIKELETKKAEMLVLEQQQANQQKELNQIRDRLYREEQSHCSEVERMKTEISDLTEKLHQKEITIATITEKAVLLERQLQMELEIKGKMLGKQQQVMDLSKKERKTCSDSTHSLEHENGRLRNEYDQLSKDMGFPLLVNPITLFGMNGANHTSVKMPEEEERAMPNGSEWAAQSDVYKLLSHYRTQSDVVGAEHSIHFSPQRPSRDPESIPNGRSPSPAEEYPELYRSCFPETNKFDMLLNQDYVIEDPKVPSPETPFAATATEKFLQEEEKRARDFEQVLNSHIEELQKQSETTLRKYASLKQSRHR